MKHNRSLHFHPSGVAYTPNYQDRDGLHWYIKEVKSNGSDLGTPDTWTKAMVKMTTDFIDENPIEQVRNSAKKVFSTKQGEQNIMYTIKSGQDDVDSENFFRNLSKGRFYSVMLMEGISHYDNTAENNVQKIKWFPIVRFENRYNYSTPDGREPEIKIVPLPNPTSSALTLTNVGALTGLTAASAENDLDDTAWDALDFSVSPGATDQTLGCAMTY